MTTLAQILAQLDTDTTKTAQQKTPAPQADQRVAQAQQALHNSMQNVKTASQEQTGQDATALLQKTAQDLAQAERNALLKEAHLYGAAVADGFLTQLNTYGEYAQKIAAYEGHQPQHQPQPQHQHQPQRRVKTAQEDFAEGVDAGLVKIAAISMDCFERGFQQTLALLDSANQ